MFHHFHIPRLPEGTPEAIRRFAVAIGGLCEAIGRVFNPQRNPIVPGLVIYNYILRTRARFNRLMTLLLAGRAPRVRTPGKPREKTERKTPRLRLPTRKGWLGKELQEYSHFYAGGIFHTLNDPETAAVIAGSPQAQRLLRPLCRMLGFDMPCIPPRPRRPRKPRPPKPKRLTRKQREAILWYPNSEGKPMKLLPKKLPRD